MIPPEGAGPPVGDPPEFVVLDDGEVVYHPVPVESAPAMANLFGAENPADVVARSSEVAVELTKVLESQRLYKEISGKRHVLVDGWTLLGSMLGVFPVVVWSRKIEDGWEARVEARTLSGAVVGAAEGQCTRQEKEWGPNPTRGKPRDDYALRSMAQTRATSKALRGPLGFIVHLAGFAPTPEAEISSEPSRPSEPKPVSQAQHNMIGALIGELDRGPAPAGYGDWVSYSRAWIGEQYGKHSRKDLTTREAGALIDMLTLRRDEMPI
jgi:hypothetical protein